MRAWTHMVHTCIRCVCVCGTCAYIHNIMYVCACSSTDLYKHISFAFVCRHLHDTARVVCIRMYAHAARCKHTYEQTSAKAYTCIYLRMLYLSICSLHARCAARACITLAPRTCAYLRVYIAEVCVDGLSQVWDECSQRTVYASVARVLPLPAPS